MMNFEIATELGLKPYTGTIGALAVPMSLKDFYRLKGWSLNERWLISDTDGYCVLEDRVYPKSEESLSWIDKAAFERDFNEQKNKPAQSDKTAPALKNQVTREYLESQIINVTYSRPIETLTHCAIQVENGFVFTGESACEDPNNFDADKGKTIAYENAVSKMWVCYGFLLKEQMAEADKLSTAKGRLLAEKAELDSRLTKLASFKEKEKPDFIADEQWELLDHQLETMTAYSDILDRRLDLMGGDDD